MTAQAEIDFIQEKIEPILKERRWYSESMERAARFALVANQYYEFGSGSCSTVYRKGDSKYLIKLKRFESEASLLHNPRRDDNGKIILPVNPWRDTFEVVSWVKEVYNNNPFEIAKQRRLAEHFLFFEYLHPLGLVAVQKVIDRSMNAQIKAANEIDPHPRWTHTGNYGLDGNRPVIIDWF